MAATAVHAAPRARPAHRPHTVPLWALFMALLALTAGEVGLFEIWHRSAADGQPLFSKLALVLLILLFTLPKALIVLIYFMHLKFERQFVVTLAIAPFVLAVGAVLAILSDALALREESTGQVPALHEYVPDPHAPPPHAPGAMDEYP